MSSKRGDARSAVRMVVLVILLVVAMVAAVPVAWVISLLVHQEKGPRESDRLLAVVENLPGVSSADGEGSSSISYSSTVRTAVTMSSSATSEQLEDVLLTWTAAANPNHEPTFEKWLHVSFDDGECAPSAIGTTDQTPVTQLKDTVRFLKAMCAHTPTASVTVRDDQDERHVEIDHPQESTPEQLGIEQLRRLPGATTERDVWQIDGVLYDWGGEG